jgi:hypothetical protein
MYPKKFIIAKNATMYKTFLSFNIVSTTFGSFI